MAQFPAMPLWTDAYLADTTDLSAEEHGVYLLLLMAAWRSPDCRLPNDDIRLARMARVGVKKWQKMRPVMERFFTVGDDGLTQKRLLAERSRVETSRSQASQAGKASALKRKKTNSTDVATEPPTKVQESISISIKKDSVTNVTAQNPEKDFFDEGKELLGKNAGGFLTKIAKAHDRDWPRCLALIRDARNKGDPREWLAGCAQDKPRWQRDEEAAIDEIRQRVAAI